ncbi:MAG: hypothetical protein NTZ17_04535 [Phycisphaerae bacterium]|nr:hypothetical protein [Phycisphaerae bacterium]
MGTRRIGVASVALLAILLAGARSHAQSLSSPAVSELGQLRILYVGHPDSDRQKDFVQFLGQHFSTVKTGDLRAFKEKDTDGFDVTLLDWDANVLEGPYPKVSEGFARPVITLGVRGALICRRWRLKAGYL